MASGNESRSDINKMMGELSSDDQRLFRQYRDELLKEQIKESPLLDQLCWVKLVRSRLSDSYAKVLSAYQEKLAQRTMMPGSWRKSRTIKSPGEFESPMPWLHPFKMAGEALAPLEEELDRAVASGDRSARDMTKLGEVLEEHNIQFPISSQEPAPKFPPRSLRTFQ